MVRDTKKIVQICFQNQLFKNAKICSYFGLLLIADRLHTDTAPGTRPNLQLIWGKKISMAFYLHVEENTSRSFTYPKICQT